MFGSDCKTVTRACAAAFLLSLAASPAALGADDKPYVMKISLATVDDPLHAFARNYAAAVEKDSNGRIKVEIYPSSQLGSTQRQVEGVQFGEIQCLVVPPEFLTGIDERFEVLAAPGLGKSMAAGQRLAVDPDVRKLMLGLGVDKGLHGLLIAAGIDLERDRVTIAPVPGAIEQTTPFHSRSGKVSIVTVAGCPCLT